MRMTFWREFACFFLLFDLRKKVSRHPVDHHSDDLSYSHRISATRMWKAIQITEKGLPGATKLDPLFGDILAGNNEAYPILLRGPEYILSGSESESNF